MCISLSPMMIIELLFAFAKTGQHTRLYGHFNQFLWVMAMFFFCFSFVKNAQSI